MKPGLQNHLSRQCKEGQREFGFTLSDQDPEPLVPGDAADAGISIEAARSDHRHSMPATPDSVLDGSLFRCFYWTDFAVNGGVPDGTVTWADGAQGLPSLDEPANSVVDIGTFGADQGSTGTAGAPANEQTAGIIMFCGSSNTSTETTIERTLFDRMRRFRTKIRLAFPTAGDPEGDLPGFAQAIQIWVGGFISSINRRADSATNALFFEFTAPNSASGIEKWRAVSIVDGVRFDVDTDVVIPYQPAGGTDQRAGAQTLEILYDPDAPNGAEARFRIDGETVARITAAQGLPIGKRFAGWGVFSRKTANTPTLTCTGAVTDFLTYFGVRIA